MCALRMLSQALSMALDRKASDPDVAGFLGTPTSTPRNPQQMRYRTSPAAKSSGHGCELLPAASSPAASSLGHGIGMQNRKNAVGNSAKAANRDGMAPGHLPSTSKRTSLARFEGHCLNVFAFEAALGLLDVITQIAGCRHDRR